MEHIEALTAPTQGQFAEMSAWCNPLVQIAVSPAKQPPPGEAGWCKDLGFRGKGLGFRGQVLGLGVREYRSASTGDIQCSLFSIYATKVLYWKVSVMVFSTTGHFSGGLREYGTV